MSLINASHKRWQKWLLLSLVLTLVVLTVAACGQKMPGEGKGEAVATYKLTADATEELTISTDEFNKYIAFFKSMQPTYAVLLDMPEYQQVMLNQYIAYKIKYLEVSLNKEDTKRIDEAANAEYKPFNLGQNPDGLAYLQAADMKKKDFKKFFTLIQAGMLDRANKVTDEEISAYFDKNQDYYALADFRHILVSLTDTEGNTVYTAEEAQARIEEVKAKLTENEDWDAMAKEYSDDFNTMSTGGLYSQYEPIRWNESSLIEATAKQEVGVIGEPISTNYGYHLIKVEKRVPQTLDKLEENDILQIRQNVAQENLSNFIENDLPNLIISINLPTDAQSGETDGAGNDGINDNGSNDGEAGDASSAGTTNSDPANSESGAANGNTTNNGNKPDGGQDSTVPDQTGNTPANTNSNGQ
jgi:foldase protein PrsA